MNDDLASTADWRAECDRLIRPPTRSYGSKYYHADIASKRVRPGTLEDRCLTYMRDHGVASSEQIAGALKETRRRASSAMSKLHSMGLVEQHGVRSNSRWVMP
mgnify:FL=1